MNKKFRYKAVLYSYNEDDRDYNLFSEKKDYDNLLKIRKIFVDAISLKTNCFKLARGIFEKRGHEEDWGSDDGLCIGIRRIEKNRTAESFSDWIMKLN